MKKNQLAAGLLACLLLMPAFGEASFLGNIVNQTKGKISNEINNRVNSAKTDATNKVRNKINTAENDALGRAIGGIKVITISHLPQSLEEFKSMPQLDLTKPENTAVMFLCAANLWTIDREEGIAALNLLSNPKRQLTVRDKQFLIDRLGDKEYLPRSYFEGATPKNNYTPSEPLTVRVKPDIGAKYVEQGYKRLYLKSGGADSDRAIKLRQKDDVWYLWEYFGLLPGIRVLVDQGNW